MMMIHNHRQLEATRREILHLKERLTRLRTKKMSATLRKLGKSSLEKMLRDLEEQVRVYTEALRGRVGPEVLSKLLSTDALGGPPRISEAMLLLRLARKMTQEDLARKLGTKREAIARWEREDYEGYTLATVQKIFEALGCRLELLVRVAG